MGCVSQFVQTMTTLVGHGLCSRVVSVWFSGGGLVSLGSCLGTSRFAFGVLAFPVS